MIQKARKNGLLGEVMAARYLRAEGYLIAEANFRTRQGEVDIIAQRDDMLIFCEVKTRSNTAIALPRESVDARKQRRIVLAALQYVRQIHFNGVMRFDVIEVTFTDNGSVIVQQLPDAFRVDESGPLGI